MEAVAVQQLLVVRRAAGKVLYNIDRSRPGADDAAAYREVMGRTYAMPVTADDEARAPLDVEETLTSADYLRAWLLAEQLRAQMVSRYGPTWWQSIDAGNWLRQMVAPGNLLTADGLAARMGESGIRPEPFVAHVTAMLAGSPPPQPPAARAEGGAGLDGGIPGGAAAGTGPEGGVEPATGATAAPDGGTTEKR